MEKTPSNSSKKTPIIAAIAGLAVIGGGYLGGMYYVSNKAMDFLHAQVDKINASEKNHAEIQDEKRGLFTSTAKVIVSDDTSSIISAPLTVRHGLFNTDIDSDDVRFQDKGQNALKILGGNAEKATLAIHLHNSSLKDNDLRGSSIALTAQGQMLGNDAGSHIMLNNPAFKLTRNSDGSLVASIMADKIESSEGMGSFSNVGRSTLSFTYDAAWSERLVQASSAYAHDNSEQNRESFENILKTRLPDIHADMRDVKNRASESLPETAAEHLVIDVVRDQAAAITRFTGNLEGIQGEGAKGNVIIKVALDQRVVDTAMNLSHRADSDMEKDIVALAQTSPRLVLEELRMFDDKNMSLTATGEASIDGSSIHSIDDLNLAAIVAKATLKGLPDGAAQMAEMNGISGIKDGQPVNITVNKGSVAINGKRFL